MDKVELINILEKEGFNREILKAFDSINREDFVDKKYKEFAYLDAPLPLMKHSTISQPTVLAFILELLELYNGIKILEIGSGSGYLLALINSICSTSFLYGIEIHEPLVKRSENLLIDYPNIQIINADGKDGLSNFAPFNRIILSAAVKTTPSNLINQLTDGGYLIFPMNECLYKLRKEGNLIIKKVYPGFRFVPII